MKNSTVLLIVGVLGLGGVGTYLYLKNKKAPTTLPTTPPTIPPTSTKSGTEVNSSLGLPLPTDKIVALYNEMQTENYKKAKLLSNDIQKKIASIPQYKRTKSKDAMWKDVADWTAQANALGYKILDNGEIEKM